MNRHQRHLYNIIENDKDIYITRAHKISYFFTSENDEITQFHIDKISDFVPITEITLLKHFTFNYKFKKGLFLVIGKDAFVEIICSFLYKDNYYCLSKQWKTVRFNENLHCYEIEEEEMEILSIQNITNLDYPVPLQKLLCEQKIFINTKHNFYFD
jgi:hypothetical protein